MQVFVNNHTTYRAAIAKFPVISGSYLLCKLSSVKARIYEISLL